jgi:hypothetical protein
METMGGGDEAVPPMLDVLLLRSFEYQERLLFSPLHRFPAEVVTRVLKELSLPRYVGVIRVQFPGQGALEVLVDSTSTFRNLSYLAVLTDGANESLHRVAAEVAARIDRPHFRPA